MNKRKPESTVRAVLMTVLLSLAGGVASAAPPAGQFAHSSSELAARRGMVLTQMEQRVVTPAKRQVAINALKAERMKVYKAKQQVNHSKPVSIDNK